MRYWIPILVVLAGHSAALCQLAATSSKVNYEGQKVASVDLVANPKISVDSLGPMVELRAGDNYSGAKVNRTVSALGATGRFTKVDVQVKPDADGLHVTFTLEPAFYFGVLDFPGVGSRFSYTRLLQVTDIPGQTAYKQQLVS